MLMKILLFLIHHQFKHPVRAQRQQQSVEIVVAKIAHIRYLSHAQRHPRKRKQIQVFKAYHRLMHLNRLKVVRLTFRIVVPAAAAPMSTILYQR